MPDPIARKLLKKKMLDRWENEGGRINSDATSADETKQTSETKSHVKKLPSPIPTAEPKPTKRRQAIRK